jgi:hypothetical protein
VPEVQQIEPREVAVKRVEAAPVVKPTPTVIKKSITCTKGKITKKVTGTKPKCPVGWKKK